MTTLYEGAFAKVNLTLDVLGKREDGYHDLQSVMQTISVRDDVEIDVGTGKPWILTCTNPEIPTDERNLAWKRIRAAWQSGFSSGFPPARDWAAAARMRRRCSGL